MKNLKIAVTEIVTSKMGNDPLVILCVNDSIDIIEHSTIYGVPYPQYYSFPELLQKTLEHFVMQLKQLLSLLPPNQLASFGNIDLRSYDLSLKEELLSLLSQLENEYLE